MKIAAITDIHGNVAALDAVLTDIRARGADAIVQLGDSVSGPLWPRETLARIQELGCANIRGNHDRQLLGDPADMRASDRHARETLTPAQLVWLAQWPAILQWRADVLLFHARPHDDLQYMLEDPARGYAWLRPAGDIERDVAEFESRLMMCGHSHMPRVYQLADGRMIVNAGSVGLQAFDDDEGGYHVIENGSPHARYVMIELTERAINAAIIAVAYDWRAASRRAAEHGRQEWADWLLTGQVRERGQ
jgi:predicted phosphodiesterase